MNQEHFVNDPSFAKKTFHFISNVINRYEDPVHISDFIAKDISEIIQADCIIFINFLERDRNNSFKVFSLYPAERSDWARSSEILNFYEILYSQQNEKIWRSEEKTEVSEFLIKESFELSLSVPLKKGNSFIGAMLFLGLKNETQLDSEIEMLKGIANTVSLAMQYSFLFNNNIELIKYHNEELKDLKKKLEDEYNQRKILERELRKRETKIKTMQEESQKARISLLSVLEDEKKAQEDIKKLNAELEDRIEQRTQILEVQRLELVDNRKALLNIVDDLNIKTEKLTISTEKLEAANKELEAFSYSISHDLRAPLRALDGFARILKEDHSSSLDEEGNRLLKVITDNAKKMGNLIDDLLAFSRLSRKEIKISQVDMLGIVNSVYAELTQNLNKEKIDFKVNAVRDAYCDSVVFRQVWINLLSNALKFSSLKEKQKIEVGSETIEKETIYYVKDNGVGFDMRYLNKLFGVFQRLHSEKEFEGTGVGLAIVQRIVNKHGGKVWAESKLNESTTFYFSLPIEN